MSSRRPTPPRNPEPEISSEPSRRRSRSRHKRYRRLVVFEPLETRALLATLDFADGTLTYNAAVGAMNNLSVTAIGGSGYQFIENGETFTYVTRLPESCTSTSTKSNSVTISCAAPNDITALAFNLDDGADILALLSTYDPTRINGGSENDVIRIGDALNSLDGILGVIDIDGGANAAQPIVSRSVTAGATVVSNNLPEGDRLIVNDVADNDANTYAVDGNTVTRGGTLAIAFVGTESLDLVAGAGFDVIDVIATAGSTTTSIATTGGGDSVTVTTTGASSNLDVTGDAAVNLLRVLMTGNNSVTLLAAGGGNDALLQSANGTGSGVALNGEAGEDTMTVLGSAAGSATAAAGGDDNDFGNAGDATHSLDPIQGAVVFNGGANGAAMRNLATILDSELPAQPFSVGSKFNPVSSIAMAVGDGLRLSDAPKGGSQRYEIHPDQAGRTGDSPRTLLYSAMETLLLTAGSGADQVEVAVPDGGTQLPSVVTINGGGAEDNLVHVNAQSGRQRIILDTERDNSQVRAPFEIRNANRLNVTGSPQDDVVLSKLSGGQLLGGSLVDGGLGNDVLCSGSNLDLLVGGVGADFLCSNGGNTILLPDHAINAGVLTPINPPNGQDGDLIQLGEDDSTIPLGADMIKGANGGCGKITLSGAFQLDVLCWLKAQFQATLPTTGSDAPLVRFELLTAAPSGDGEGESAEWHNRLNDTDVNGDGVTSPFDALLIINTLNAEGPRRLANLPAGEGEGNAGVARAFYDVNNDRFVTPVDVLFVINAFLEGDSLVLAAEGEAAPAPEYALWPVNSEPLFGLIAVRQSDPGSVLTAATQSVGRRAATTRLSESTVRPAVTTVRPPTDAMHNRFRMIQPVGCLGDDLLSLLATDVMERSQRCDAIGATANAD